MLPMSAVAANLPARFADSNLAQEQLRLIESVPYATSTRLSCSIAYRA
jgi:hypothetical protein